MGRPKGIVKPAGSGRKPGTPNKLTTDLFKICEEENIDPFRMLCRFAVDRANPQAQRAVEKLCEYLYPKRSIQAIDVSDMQALERAKEIAAMPEEEIKKLAGK